VNDYPNFEPDEIAVSTMDPAVEDTPVRSPRVRGCAELLDDLRRYVRRFVAASDAQLVAVVLWVVHTYALDAAEITGYLMIHSAVKRSGKSLLLEVLAELVHRPMLAANMTAAVLFRVADDLHPTLLFDEVDVVFSGKSERADELRGLLNAGYRKGGTAWRMEMKGSGGVARSFDVFGPKALAGIGQLPDTIGDRSIPIALARKVRGIDVERHRARGKLEETAPLREQMQAWVAEHIDELTAARPDLPDELNDRQQDVWEPLLAIADMAGGEWPSVARVAALELHGDGAEADTSAALLLLHHLRDLFAEHGDPAALSTETILMALVDVDSGPWGRWWVVDSDHGKRSAASGLAKILKPFGVSSTKVKIDGLTLRGYRRESFKDARLRYLPQVDATHGTHGTSQVAPTGTVPSVASVPSIWETEAT
jgi:Protein of unknown function (DUF3631)